MRSLRWTCVIVALGLPMAAAAQEFRATLNGRVTDSSRAAVPSATVTVQHAETGEVVAVTTDSEGRYRASFLKPGAYLLTVELAGFRKSARRLTLQVGQTATVDVELSVGQLSEEVTIIAETPLLDATKADRGTVIDNQRVSELPLNGRNPFMLSTLVAGVNFNGNPIYQRPFDNGAIADWSINGGQNRNNEFLLDGAPNNAVQGGNNIAYVPPVDSVQEFKIVTNPYDAQYGRTAGGVVNVSLKSGTNAVHGTVYEYLRRTFLDSNSFLLNARQRPKAQHYLDQYGVELDGPVRLPGYDGRNRTFFLVQYEGYREGTPAPQVQSTIPEAFRRGDFSSLRTADGRPIIIYDPATGRLVNGSWVRDPFPGNIIPADRINPIAQQLLSYYPSPNTTTPGSPPWQQNVQRPDNINRDRFHNLVAKLDHSFGPNDRAFVRYVQNRRQEFQHFSVLDSGPAQDGQLPLQRINYAGVADWVHILGPRTMLNVRASANRYTEVMRVDATLGFDPAPLGFAPGLLGQLPVRKFPRIQVAEFISIGRESFSFSPSNTFSLQPNLSLQRGGHSLRAGADLRYIRFSPQVSGAGGMRLEFSRGATQRDFNQGDALSGNAVASLLLGALSGGYVDVNVFPTYNWKYAAPWVQDDWKVSPRLTVNLGLRWDLNYPVRERFDRLNYAFDPAAASPVASRVEPLLPAGSLRGGLRFVGKDGAPDDVWQLDRDNLQARVGAAYLLGQRTVLRGGYGRFYLNPTAVSWNQGFSYRTPVVASLDGGRTSLSNIANPFPNGVITPPGAAAGLATFLGRDVGYSQPGFRLPHVDQFSIGLQRQLPWGTLLELSYVGSRTREEQTGFGGINDPPLAFVQQCDVTRGGDRNLCDSRVPNPFFGVPGFEGTSRFTSPTISRYDLARPFPQFGSISESERNEGKIWYDSVQLVVHKRTSHGLNLNATYTYAPRWLEEAGYIDTTALLENRSPYFAHRKHRLTASGVWQVPVGKGRRFLDRGGVGDYVLGGWELAASWIYHSGQPWGLPGNLELIKDPSMPVNLDAGQFIRGAKPCVAELVGGQYRLVPVSIANGCTEPNFQVRAPYQTRTTMFRDDRLRQPSFRQLDLNLSKTVALADRVKLQVRVEAFNVFNSPMYDQAGYVGDYNSSDFGTINKDTTQQSNYPRFIQLGFKVLF